MANFVGINPENSSGMSNATAIGQVDRWISKGGSAHSLALAEKYARRWQKFVAKKTSGYVISRNEKRQTTTLCHYDIDQNKGDKYSLPVNDDYWMNLLRFLRLKGEKFTDSNFPPGELSLFHDPHNPREVDLRNDVKKWVRISELFNKTRFFKLTFFDDDSFRLCGFYSLEELEFEALDDGEADPPSKEKAIHKAQDICLSALGSKREVDYSSVHCTDTIRDWLEEQKVFENIKEVLCPLVLRSFGNMKCEYQSQPGYVPTISIAMECNFRPEGNISFFQRGSPDEQFVKPGDVAQGALGDCYYLGGLSVVSTNQELLFDCFPNWDKNLDGNLWKLDPNAPADEQQYNEEGLYAMTFYRNHERRNVLVDDYIPCDDNELPVFAQLPRDGSTEIWSLIAEKAFAKLNGSYEAIIGGQEEEALQDLTGGLPLSYQISGKNVEQQFAGSAGEDKLYEFMKDLLAEGSMLGCSVAGEETEQDLGQGILANHAYGVLTIYELKYDGQDVRLIQIRNPWGDGQEWNGDWRDDDPRWSKVSKTIKDDMGLIQEEDGTWWMEFSDFKKTFDELQVCRLLNNSPEWTHHLIISKWEAHTAGGTENLHLNPQFQLYLEQDCKVYVELRQPDRRSLGKEGYEVAITPIVVRDCEPSQRYVVVRQQDIEGELVLHHSRSRVVELDLKARDKPYNIIACSGQKGYEAEFYMEVHTRGPARIEPLHDYASLPCCAQCNELLHETFLTVGENKSIHKECYEDYQMATAAKCAQCGEAVCKVEGKFSGQYYSLKDQKQDLNCPGKHDLSKFTEVAGVACDACFERSAEPSTMYGCRGCNYDVCRTCYEASQVKVHIECYTEYQASLAPSCGHCGKGIFKMEGQFSGLYYDVADGTKIHEECWGEYQLSKADRCIQCGEAVARVEGRFNGKYYTVDEGKVHLECWEERCRSTAPKCIHCNQPCSEIAGRFSGLFYELGKDKGHCHVECFDSYLAPAVYA